MMMYQTPGSGVLDYFPCRYGGSKLLFRGPRRRIPGPGLVAIGGSETYGKFVAEPWPALLEKALSRPVINLGSLNAGIEALAGEPAISQIVAEAGGAIVQLVGAAGMSNRFYDVHPRRNDRFLSASADLRALCPDIDFAEFSFIRHMLGTLRVAAPEVFALLTEELRARWVDRMRRFLWGLPGRKVLLWLGDWQADGVAAPGPDPARLTADMVAQVLDPTCEVVRVDPSPAARNAWAAGMPDPAAAAFPNPAIHAEIAAALHAVLRRDRRDDAP